MIRFHPARIISLAVLAAAASLPAATAAAAPAAAATSYTVTDLGSLGQGQSDANAINATGQVTGYSYLSTLVSTPQCPPVYGNTKKTCVEHPWHAFSYGNGTMTDLGTLGGNLSGGYAINRSGQVAGWAETKKGGQDAALWSGNKTVDLGALAPLAGSSSIAYGINDSGQVAGAYGTGSTTHAFLYSNGTMTGLPEPSFTGPNGCEAEAINNTGQIAGACADTTGATHLMLWQNGTATDLGTLSQPGSYSYTQAVSINNNGQIAGTVNAGGTTEGFLYSNGTLTNLGSFLPAAINDNGVMVGGDQIDSGGTVQNLNNLIPAGSGYQIQNATGINDNGQIAANATCTPNCQTHALLLNPS